MSHQNNTKIYNAVCLPEFNKLNKPSLYEVIFRLTVTNRAVLSQHRLSLDIPKVNQVSFGNKNIRSFGPKIWNSLPPHIKSCENLETFKRVKKLGWHYL